MSFFVVFVVFLFFFLFVFFQAEDGIRDLVRSRGLGDVYKRQLIGWECFFTAMAVAMVGSDADSGSRRGYLHRP